MVLESCCTGDEWHLKMRSCMTSPGMGLMLHACCTTGWLENIMQVDRGAAPLLDLVRVAEQGAKKP